MNRFYQLFSILQFTLNKTRHGRMLFEWGLTENINQTFLFSGDLDDYSIGYSEKVVSKVFVNVEIKSLDKPELSNLTQELSAKLQRRDIYSSITEEAPAPLKKPINCNFYQ